MDGIANFVATLARNQKWPADGPDPGPIACSDCGKEIMAIRGPFCWQHEDGGSPAVGGRCAICQAEDRRRQDEARARKRAKEEIEAFDAKIPARYRMASLEDFAEAQKVALAGWLSDAQSWLLYLTGGPGAGKTHAAWAVCREAHLRGVNGQERLKFPWCVTVPDLLDCLRSEATSDGIGGTTKRYQQHDGLVFLDDLGAEKTSEFALQELYRILAARESEYRKTIITSNLQVSEIDLLSRRIASRLCTGTVYRFAGKDRRRT